ncbi:hypothetical protein [Sandaracinobacteroides hominis]|uniref:hypothetical protein n=1 Tax=Sandaracinobacteroides hominis TaxID=2780086 RepID=UPI0018F4E1BB|nr:hypothetical protein [Sandaracinobacteroides hominis]
MSEDGWFKAKRNGYGSGPPISWQGWALTIAYIAAIATAPWIARQTPEGAILLFIAATASFLLMAARTTRGGWRFRRNGKPD